MLQGTISGGGQSKEVDKDRVLLSEGRVQIISPKAAYVLGLRGVQAAYEATITAAIRSAVQLKDNEKATLRMGANERAFTYYRPSSAV